MNNVTTSDGEKSSDETATNLLERISKLPQWPREFMLELIRQRDEWKDKYEELVRKGRATKTELFEIYEHWVRITGASPDVNQFKQLVKPLQMMYSKQDIIDGMTHYHKSQDARWISVKNFCERARIYIYKAPRCIIDPNSDLSPDQQKELYHVG